MSRYQKIYFHIVFSTKNRIKRIPPNNKDEIHKYLNKIIKDMGQDLLKAHCMPEHIHLLVSMHDDMKHSDLVREIKKKSSKFINRKDLSNGKFNWQEGYGIFTCSESILPKVERYIENQEEHHRSKHFDNEFIEILKKHNLDYDEKYVLK